MPRQAVDLAAPINRIVERGHPADFPVGLRPVFYRSGGALAQIPNRVAVVREDSEAVLSVVSNRYSLVPHQRLLDVISQAIEPLDVGPVPRGIYVDRQGARMRALLKFPALAKPVVGNDAICPCLMIHNTYDGTSRIAVHIGAFRFVCTNLAVGGGGVFAGGFMAVHAGDIPIEDVAKQLASYLTGFEGILDLYRHWMGIWITGDDVIEVLEPLPKRSAEAIGRAIGQAIKPSAYAAYNVATQHATHAMRSHRTAFDLLERINRAFQERFPLPEA